jgi:hypothetical protein
MHTFAQFHADVHQLGLHLLGHGGAQYAKLPLARQTAYVGKTEKVEGLWFPFASGTPV